MKEALQLLLQNLAHIEPLSAPTAAAELVSVPVGRRIVSLEKFQDAPNRIEATRLLDSTESFCEYANRFKNSNTSVYLDYPNGIYCIIFDHHGKDEPHWQGHTAKFSPKPSLEWQAWHGLHAKKSVGQREFAEFIEENLDDISSPEANAVLKAALQFQHTEKMTLASAQNLDDGTMRFNLHKDNAAAVIDFPHRISLHIPVYENEAHCLLDGRIRYRASADGVLAFLFSFVKNPARIQRDQLKTIAAKIKENLGDVAFYEGT